MSDDSKPKQAGAGRPPGRNKVEREKAALMSEFGLTAEQIRIIQQVGVKKKNGRPKVELTPEQIMQISLMRGYGLTEEEICTVLRISRTTLYRRKKEVTQLQEAMVFGNATAKAAVGKALFDQAIAGNVQAIKHWDFTRGGYSATPQIEIHNLVMQQIEATLVYLEQHLEPAAYERVVGLLADAETTAA